MKKIVKPLPARLLPAEIEKEPAKSQQQVVTLVQALEYVAPMGILQQLVHAKQKLPATASHPAAEPLL